MHPTQATTFSLTCAAILQVHVQDRPPLIRWFICLEQEVFIQSSPLPGAGFIAACNSFWWHGEGICSLKLISFFFHYLVTSLIPWILYFKTFFRLWEAEFTSCMSLIISNKVINWLWYVTKTTYTHFYRIKTKTTYTYFYRIKNSVIQIVNVTYSLLSSFYKHPSTV